MGNCRGDANPQARLLVVELLIYSDLSHGWTTPLICRCQWLDCSERRAEAFGALYDAAGFRLTRIRLHSVDVLLRRI